MAVNKRTIARIKKEMEAAGMPFIGEVEDNTSPSGQVALDALEAEVTRRGGIVKSVVWGATELVFCGPNPTGAKFVHRLPRERKAVA